MTKVINSLQTNENEQGKGHILIIIPDFALVFGVEAITAMLANYVDYHDEDDDQRQHIHSALQLLALLTPHLSNISKL